MVETANNSADAFSGVTVDTDNGSLGSFVGAASGIAIAAYLAAVIYQGNLSALGTQLMTEEGYLEFLVALVVLWALAKYGPGGPIFKMLLGTTVIGVGLTVSGKLPQLGTTLQAFGSGQANMLQTIQALFSNVTPAAPTPAVNASPN